MRERQRTQLPVTENWLDLEHSKELSAISRLLDDHPKIIELVLQDLLLASASQGRDTGAKGMTAERATGVVPDRRAVVDGLILAFVPDGTRLDQTLKEFCTRDD